MTIASGGTPHDQYESVDEEKGTQPSQAQVEVQLSLQAALSASVLSGILFGIALHRSDVFRVETIRDQMLMKNFDMLKVFLFAAGVSTAALTLLRIVPGTHHLLERSAQDHRSSLGFPATTLGAFLLGAGMTISGSCPGTVYAQIGSGDVAAFYTVLGLVLGAGVFGFLQPSLRAFVSWKAMESRVRALAGRAADGARPNPATRSCARSTRRHRPPPNPSTPRGSTLASLLPSSGPP